MPLNVDSSEFVSLPPDRLLVQREPHGIVFLSWKEYAGDAAYRPVVDALRQRRARIKAFLEMRDSMKKCPLCGLTWESSAQAVCDCCGYKFTGGQGNNLTRLEQIN